MTIRSILSEVVRAFFFLRTQAFITFAMYSYRSLVMMLSLSSSSSFSTAATIASMDCLEPSGSLTASSTFSSRSNSLTAYQRAWESSITPSRWAPIAARASSTVLLNSCWGTAAFRELAREIASAAASLEPVPFKALVSTTLQPRVSPSLLISIWSPFFLTRSIIFSASTTGIPSSKICVVR